MFVLKRLQRGKKFMQRSKNLQILMKKSDNYRNFGFNLKRFSRYTKNSSDNIWDICETDPHRNSDVLFHEKSQISI